MDQPGLLFRDAELLGRGQSAVRVRGGAVVEVANVLEPRGESVIDACGGILLPGLHDHHCHLLATAAAAEAVQCGPPTVRSRQELAAAILAAAPRSGWVRGVGYDQGVAGDLDRKVLDALRSDVAVRVQHRGGALWVVNSRGLSALGVGDSSDDDVAGIERDGAGRATGRLWRLEHWLRARLPVAPAPDLAALSARLTRLGITGVSDATPNLDASSIHLLRSSALRQRVLLLGDPNGRSPGKIIVSDHALPSFDTLTTAMRAMRPRPVALHCVSRAALALILAAFAEVGSMTGDRIEHGAVIPPELRGMVCDLGLAVVTQPSLLTTRGDEYLDRVDAQDVEWLWPFRSLLAAGVPVGCSSDAPYGDLDPWSTVRAAVSRRAPSGRVVVAHERVSPAQALRGFLSDPLDPGGPPRAVARGAPADLVLLDSPLSDALREPSRERVRATLIGGALAYNRDVVAT